MPAALDEIMVRGDCRLLRFQVINEETGNEVGTLSGWTFFATIKETHDQADVDALIQMALGDGIEVVDDGNSIIEVTIPPSATATLTGRTTRLYMDVEAVDGAAQPWTIALGRLTVRADVTQAVS